MQKHLFCILCFVVVSTGILFANSAFPQEDDILARFDAANNFYQQGKYNEAIKGYEGLLDGSIESAPILYNLANAYYKSGKIGKAIVNYERALRLTPRDADLNANLNYAETHIKSRVLNNKGFWAWRPLSAYVKSFTVNELTVFSSGMYLLILLLCVISIVYPQIKKGLLLSVFLLILLVLFNSFIIWHKGQEQSKYAVTIVPETDAMFGPFESATKFFKLYEGMSVVVIQSKDDWDKVRRSDGKIGWVKSGVVEVV